jgi:site-specific DNA-methyltransferase (adenine-specific)
MLGIKWHIGTRKLSELKEWDKNPRKITEANFQRLKDRLKDRGLHDVLVIDTNDVILSGNMRKRALSEMGVEDVSVMWPERPLTEEEREKVALESNLNDGQNDWDMLANMFEPALLLDVGFSEKDLLGAPDKQIYNEEVNTDELLGTLEHECPKCGFMF